MTKLIISKIRTLSKERNPNETLDDSTSVSSLGEREVDEISKKYLTMTSINKFCRTIIILINPLTSPGEGVTVFTSPYLSAGPLH